MQVCGVWNQPKNGYKRGRGAVLRRYMEAPSSGLKTLGHPHIVFWPDMNFLSANHQSNEMDISSVQAREQLDAALQKNDVARVAQLFNDSTLDANDATEALRRTNSIRDPSVVAVLPQNGADASVFPIRRIRLSKPATEILRLLSRHVYDLTLKGHRKLQ